MKNVLQLVCLTLILVTVGSLSLQAQTPAFPTAEGFGRFATGGRGGRVVAVTNLEDYNDYVKNGPLEDTIPGSFRWALCQYPNEPITVVFRVSGIIHLKGELRRMRSNFTIAGQTAPGDGICIRGAKVNLGGSTNFIIRHIRFRIGLHDGDGKFIAGGALGFENGSNAIFDHCTFGWSGEENTTIYDDHFITVQWCLLHEGLYVAGHAKGARSYGCQWGGSPATYHHNLLAHNVSRSARFNGASNASGDNNVLMDFVNNVNYNWGKRNSCYGGEREASKKSTHECNFVNNYYKPGPATPSGSYFIAISNNRDGKKSWGPSYWYFNGNVMEGDEKGTDDNWSIVDNGTIYPKDSLIRLSPMSIESKYQVAAQSAEEAFDSVLKGVGAFPRDASDLRIINEVTTGTASGKGTVEKYVGNIVGTDTTWVNNSYFNKPVGIIDSPDGVGGYPEYATYNIITDLDGDGMDDAWELLNHLNPANAMDGNLVTKEGYTALEVYLNHLVGEKIDPSFITGIHQTSVSSLMVYPTSTSDVLTLSSNVALKIASVYALDGRKMLTADLSATHTVNVSSLVNGSYLLSVLMDGNKVERVKFQKK